MYDIQGIKLIENRVKIWNIKEKKDKNDDEQEQQGTSIVKRNKSPAPSSNGWQPIPVESLAATLKLSVKEVKDGEYEYEDEEEEEEEMKMNYDGDEDDLYLWL
ncbi:MAG: hypothetical protein EZS28_055398, partial [Streblomastix strix]